MIPFHASAKLEDLKVEDQRQGYWRLEWFGKIRVKVWIDLQSKEAK